MVRRAIKVSMYIMTPMLVGLIVCAEPLVRFVLTEKWLPSVFYLRIACLAIMVIPISTAYMNAIQAIRSDTILKLQIVKRILDISALFLTVGISIKAVAYGLLFSSLTNPAINAIPAKRLFDYGFIDSVRDILPTVLLSILMGFLVYPLIFLEMNDMITLMTQMLLGAIIYVSGSILFHIDSYEYLYNNIKPYIRQKIRH